MIEIKVEYFDGEKECNVFDTKEQALKKLYKVLKEKTTYISFMSVKK